MGSQRESRDMGVQPDLEQVLFPNTGRAGFAEVEIRANAAMTIMPRGL